MTTRSFDHLSRLSPEQRSLAEDRIAAFEHAWQRGERPAIAGYLPLDPDVRTAVLIELVPIDREFRHKAGADVEFQNYLTDFPELAGRVDLSLPDSTFVPRAQTATLAPPTDGAATAAAASSSEDHPEQIGRYRIERLLGRGGFGVVYLGQDDDLQRLVAIKVPLPDRVADSEAYLTEARILARLDHANIVPVHDVGRTSDGLCFVVSKFIAGSDLRQRIGRTQSSAVESAEIIAIVAEALHHAHKKGLVHRDIKPENILIDHVGKPYVADFGIALRDGDFGADSGYKLVGTPAYMSPEQARGEGHLVDGRSDIFSLGIVFYELLAGINPFKAANWDRTIYKITSAEVKPPRQINDAIPKELERICLKALSKRASDRYTTAKDFAADLRHFVGEVTVSSVQQSAPALNPPPVSAEPSTATPFSGSRIITIVPKGLRSFDAQDADFFLELLPGPRDRDGLPESIRFWKTRIEQTDPEETFRVGLIYGPSGCGKSSLVKSGLVPRLAEHVFPIYVEAAANETETRILHALRKRISCLPKDLGLKETLATLRHGRGIPPGRKVVIILDQFEQWLHTSAMDENSELVQALRQCDGGRVQCIVMVRDDFWLAVSRFLLALEIDLAAGHNIALTDLFGLDHARKVLAAFGRAFGTLPDRSAENTHEQNAFLTQAVSGLAENGKVVCVRLSLFAETMKSKPWTPAALAEVGGTEGVGVTFLEETFSAPSANPKHRLHQTAARAVLRLLLPETGTEIKGNMQSRSALLDASGYMTRPKEFEDLIRILDGELRLITPTDPEGSDTAGAASKVEGHQRYYQLTHDYLVHALREWLTRKQKESRRGRAELRLADRAAVWKEKQENRHLPSLWEFLNIQLLTDLAKWNEPQRKMMRRAERFHSVRTGIAGAVILLLLLSGVAISRQIEEKRNADSAAALLKRLVAADIAEVPGVVQEIDGYRLWADPLLRRKDAEPNLAANQKLHLALALLPVDQNKVAELRESLLSVSPGPFVVVRDSLSPYQGEVAEPLWKVALDPKQKDQPRFQAACALATYAPADERWSQVNTFVAGRLVTLEASALVAWREALRPAKTQLIRPLASIFRDTKQQEQPRRFATETLADYAADQADELFSLLADAEQFQFSVVADKLARHKDKAVALAAEELGKTLTEKTTEDHKELLAKRQANAAIILLRFGHGDPVWPKLKASPDPRVRSDIIHWFNPLGGDPQQILQRLDSESDVTIRRALLLMLGEFNDSQLSNVPRQPLIERLLVSYENEPDAGLHGAVEWLLRKWGQEKRVEAVVEKLTGDENRLQSRKASETRQWYVNSKKQTFVIVDAREGWFLMGSPDSEPGRLSDETQYRCHIGRRFAIAARDVTKGEFAEFFRRHPEMMGVNTGDFVKTDDSPLTAMMWYDAAQYCDWLSEQEKIPRNQWCYDPKGGAYGPGMKAKEKFWELTGYRLPTEAEWEFACRAGTVTSRFYGLSERLLPHYAWFQADSENRAWPVARLRPNDLGLFDMLGNALEWCFDRYDNYPKGTGIFEDTPRTVSVLDKDNRIVRGGAFNYQASLERSAFRNNYSPGSHSFLIGFRPARTYP
jgi:serine/threonine protein kinase/formylglycine-generating enzyme required for sulfatase activity